MNLKRMVDQLCSRARAGAAGLYTADPKVKSRAILKAAAMLVAAEREILAANHRDLAAAEAAGLGGPMLERLRLDGKRIAGMAKGLAEIAALSDPVGKVTERRKRPNGIEVKKVRVPIGTILFIYESRPNVTTDAAALCVRAGNAVILRGGKEAMHSNKIVAGIFRRALKMTGLPSDAVQLVETPDRKLLQALLGAEGRIDLVIPRGGEGLIRAVSEYAKIPVLKHYKGVCTVYVDREADLAMAEKIVLNAKIQRPSVCNAMETVLFDRRLPKTALRRIVGALQNAGVEVLGCPRTRAAVPGLSPAREKDYTTEFLSLKCCSRVVDGVQGAIDHVGRYTSHHTDAIVTRNRKTAQRFLDKVDSASVMWNASTRLADGGIYGLGAEVGISTDKLHARGPMGADDLTTYKWVVTGSGQVRS